MPIVEDVTQMFKPSQSDVEEVCGCSPKNKGSQGDISEGGRAVQIAYGFAHSHRLF
ncbi:MAG: hypothetical protein ACLUKN_06900 [Bacilli bacterium]